ncbi:MAG TPA: HD domain-containing phosphohydrolase [Clostridia bacterium]|nr:HD domain-containing phosphohydrolase [Clostridia bacterium]
MKENFRRLLTTFEALSDLGPALTSDRDFRETAPLMLGSLLNAVDAREGVLFRFVDKPAMLSSLAARGFASLPDPAVLPLLPKHVHTLARMSSPRVLGEDWTEYLSSNGNFAPQLLKCIVPLRVGARLVGMVGLGQRGENSGYTMEDMEGLSLMSHYLALGVHNYALSETLAQRVSENLRLMATVHSFYDTTLEAFAAAIDVKHVNIHGHSLRVGRYAAGIGEALGLDHNEVAGLRAAGYLHDVGKVAVDKALFGKPDKLSDAEFREMADHTVVGHQIVHGIQFPWPKVADVVRWHHERSDGTGYPDRLHLDEMTESVRIMAVSDTFDAMTSDRPYRRGMSVGEALAELVKLTPSKFDANAVQALLIQIRRDSVTALNPRPRNGEGVVMPPARPRFLDERLRSIAPPDIDYLAGILNHKVTGGRVYSA